MECDFCDRKFKYRKSFVHHMQVEHGMSDTESDFASVDAGVDKDAGIDKPNPDVKEPVNNVIQEGKNII